MLYSHQPTLNQGQPYSQDNSFIQSEFFSNRKTYISFLVNRLKLLSLVGHQPLVVSIYSDLNVGLKTRDPGQLRDL
jgi:phosphohistidine phosphatase SixA